MRTSGCQRMSSTTTGASAVCLQVPQTSPHPQQQLATMPDKCDRAQQGHLTALHSPCFRRGVALGLLPGVAICCWARCCRIHRGGAQRPSQIARACGQRHRRSRTAPLGALCWCCASSCNTCLYGADKALSSKCCVSRCARLRFCSSSRLRGTPFSKALHSYWLQPYSLVSAAASRASLPSCSAWRLL